MSNLLRSGISLFVSRRTDASPTDKSQPKQVMHRSAASDQADSGQGSEPSSDDSAQQPTEAQSPLVAYPVLHQEVAPAAMRESRALNLPRTSTSVALTSRVLIAAHSKATRPHEPHPARPVLTKTERVRLQVMQIQLRLADLALYDGPIDGVMGPETATGVRHFQTLKGLHDTGTLAPGTLSALGVSPID